MKLSEKSKSSKKVLSRCGRLAHSTVNSSLGTRNSSPSSQQTINLLQRKILKMKSKLTEAHIKLLQCEEERKIEKQIQKDFLKKYHIKMLILQENSDNKLSLDDVDKKIIQERNALDQIWQHRYDEMKKFYEKKLSEMETKETLCSKCKAFTKVNENLNLKLARYKLFDKNLDI
ncbi:hypothetical protein SteCoe_32401 [Stentor coeruleus]|uniref:Uncharacterized protein n=1 Tax=Stentor coeruleus TaxID=5963 RepID=A0A1R2AZ98_9CILI|nr:hypothetical protein SteCoe_32401 [Stentor coeruleus]